jgi:chromosome segregation ATPase
MSQIDKSLEEWARHAAASDAKVLELHKRLDEVTAWARRLEDQRDSADRELVEAQETIRRLREKLPDGGYENWR